jgi:hypothetical protein
MLTLTVMAGLLTPPEEGVIVTVDVLVFWRFPVQPATTMNTSIAPTIPMRPRNRRVEGSMKRSEITSITRNTSRIVAAGGTFMDCGATTKEEAVSVAVAVAPGAGAALVMGTAHEVTSVLPGVQVKDTEPVNPPNPVIVTGNVPMAPLATLTLLGAETWKSQAVPVSDTDCGLPLALSVTMIVPVSAPGVVEPDGANVMLSVQGVPAGAMVMGTLPHEFDAMLKSLLAAIAEMFSAVVVLVLLITRFCPVLVVVSNWPPKVRLAGLKLIAAIELLPVPVSAIWTGSWATELIVYATCSVAE